MFSFICILILNIGSVLGASIDNFQPVENVDSWDAAIQNTKALTNAILSANSSGSNDRVVVIPAGKTYCKLYYFCNHIQYYLYNLKYISTAAIVR